jgi:hypothetical protein
MDTEIAMLTAIALAVTLHLHSHPAKIPFDDLMRAQEEAALCQPLEFGMPCISMQAAEDQPETSR